MFELFITGAVILACLSPALTLSALWQQKEWRWDRLLEHLRREGWLKSLYGRARPPLYGGYLVALAALSVLRPGGWVFWESGLMLLTLTLGALLSAAQLLLRRQRRPVWTAKAMLLTALSLLPPIMAAGGSLFLDAGGAPPATRALPLLLLSLPLLPALQPVWTALAWAVLRPLDLLLKRRTFRAARAARLARKDMAVIGIAGCAGKTTTKELIAQLLADLSPLVTPEHVNTELGVAKWLLRELSRAKGRSGEQPGVMVVEMGAYAVGEVALLAEVIRPTIGVITLTSNQHLALFGSEEAIMESNRELIRALPATGHLFLNGDDPATHGLRDTRNIPTTIVGRSAASTLAARDAEEDGDGLRFTALHHAFRAPLHGLHNVTNILLALGVAQHLGIKSARMAELLRHASGPARTFTVRERGGVTVLDDTHNASQASVSAAIRWARNRPEERKILLFSGIIELGPAQAQVHRALGAEAAKVFSQVTVLDPILAEPFQAGYGKPLTSLSAVKPLTPGSLLVCVGRMPQSTINRFLPDQI